MGSTAGLQAGREGEEEGGQQALSNAGEQASQKESRQHPSIAVLSLLWRELSAPPAPPWARVNELTRSQALPLVLLTLS